MNREQLIEETIYKVTKLPDEKIQEINHFAELLLSKIEDKIFAEGIAEMICMNTYKGPAVAQFLLRADSFIPPGATLAVMPEGAALNFLMKLTNSTPFTSLEPTTMALEQELRMLTAYQNNPPDFIVLAHNDYSVFNLRFFGQDYAQSFRLWIEKHYQPILLVGNTYPFQGDEYSILLLKRQPLEPPGTKPEVDSK